MIDGYVTFAGAKHDALIVDVVEFTDPRLSLRVLVPYRHAGDPRGFAVHRPKFVAQEGLDGLLDALGKAFFAGLESHEEGIRSWDAHYDDGG